MAGRTLDRQKMRRDLHARAAVPALYRASDVDDWLADPIDVRVHTSEPVGIGEPEGGAERREIPPRIIFLVEQVPMPARGATVSVAVGQAYAIGEALPVDGVTITAAATQLSAAKAAGLPVPPVSA